MSKKTRAYKGLAEAYQSDSDYKMMRCSSRYNWGWNTKPTYIPMLYKMEFPTTYYLGHALFGNEPNMPAPWGYEVNAHIAALRVIDVEKKCPELYLVVGNVSHDGINEVPGWLWLYIFLWAYQMESGKDFSGILGVHVYGFTAEYCIEKLEEMFAQYSGKFWVTEYGILDGNPREFEKLTDYISNHPQVDRYFAFTNRIDTVEQFPYPGVELVRKFLWWYLPTRIGWIYRKYPAEPNIND